MVAGSSSRAGKTALAETVLRSLGGKAAAIKFTTTDDVFERCPRGTTCVVCDIDVPFKVIRDAATLGEKGTDTARLKDATSGPVLWTITRRSVVEQAWRATLQFVENPQTLVIEGSTIADACQPDFTFYVVHPFLSPQRWKDRARDLMARADCVVVNRQASEPREPNALVMAAIHEAHPYDLRIADVSSLLHVWANDLIPRLLKPRPRNPRESSK